MAFISSSTPAPCSPHFQHLQPLTCCSQSPALAAAGHTPARFISGALGRQAQAESIAHAHGNIHEVAALCAEGVVDAFAQVYEKEEFSRVFVLCGSGFNGIVGAYTAIGLQRQGYSAAVFWMEDPQSQVRSDVLQTLHNLKIPADDFVGTTIDFYFDVIIDALVGVGFDGGDLWPVLWRPFELVLNTSLPVLSIDVPTGWDLEAGPRDIDVRADTFVKPDVLVSLGVPKLCSKFFSGAFHYVGGRHVPQNWAIANDVQLQLHPDSTDRSVLISTNPTAERPRNGEIYGRPGQFQATLSTSRPRRRWVSEEQLENDMDLWDELE